MIIGKLKNNNVQLDNFNHAIFSFIKNFIINTDFAVLENGKYELEFNENKVFYTLTNYTAENCNIKCAEVHRKFIDFHYILSGKEVFGYKFYDQNINTADNYKTEDDAEVFEKVDNESFFVLKAGMFAIFFPCDIHRPGLANKNRSKVKKIIFKIPVGI